MKFLVDMPLSPGLARWLRAESHHVAALGLNRAADTEIITRATLEDRTM